MRWDALGSSCPRGNGGAPTTLKDDQRALPLKGNGSTPPTPSIPGNALSFGASCSIEAHLLLGLRIPRARHRDIEHRNARRIKARIGRAQIKEAADQQTRAGQQQE